MVPTTPFVSVYDELRVFEPLTPPQRQVNEKS